MVWEEINKFFLKRMIACLLELECMHPEVCVVVFNAQDILEKFEFFPVKCRIQRALEVVHKLAVFCFAACKSVLNAWSEVAVFPIPECLRCCAQAFAKRQEGGNRVTEELFKRKVGYLCPNSL